MYDLTTEQMQQIIDDLMLGRKPRVKGANADQFRQDVQKDIEFAKKHGYTVSAPAEWEV